MPQVTTNLLSVSVELPAGNISYQWRHIMCGLLSLCVWFTCFQSSIQVEACGAASSLWLIILYCVENAHLVCSFISWQDFESVLVFGSQDYSCKAFVWIYILFSFGYLPRNTCVSLGLTMEGAARLFLIFLHNFDSGTLNTTWLLMHLCL